MRRAAPPTHNAPFHSWGSHARWFPLCRGPLGTGLEPPQTCRGGLGKEGGKEEEQAACRGSFRTNLLSLLLPHLSKQRHMWKNPDFHMVGVFTFFLSRVQEGAPLQALTVLYTSHMSLSKQMPSLPPTEREVLC